MLITATCTCLSIYTSDRILTQFDRPRHGRDIGVIQLTRALHDIYNLSSILAFLLALGGILLCGHGFIIRRLDLDALAVHGKIEHNGSLVHDDCPLGSRVAPVTVNESLLRALLAYAAPRHGLTMHNFARARADRESRLAHPLDSIHSEIGRGEAALTWLLMKDEQGEVPLARLEQWYGQERLPDNWKKPTTSIGLFDARSHSKQVKAEMAKLTEEPRSL